MDRVKRAALLTYLVQKLREHGSWCGETHIQKAAYFLQTLLHVPLELQFVLYKHGPFSFDLRDDLTSFRADELLELELQYPYGPRLSVTGQGRYIQRIRSVTLATYKDRIDFVAKRLGDKDVRALERLATALFVTHNFDAGAALADRSRELTRLKPHIPPADATDSMKKIDRLIRESPA